MVSGLQSLRLHGRASPVGASANNNNNKNKIVILWSLNVILDNMSLLR